LVLDPWNGGGTTTLAASTLDRLAVGIDLNPVACSIARAKLVTSRALSKNRKRAALAPSGSAEDEPLDEWLDPPTGSYIRGWLVGAEDPIVQLAAMRLVRAMTKHLVGSNPTWVKKPDADGRPAFDRDEIDHLMRAELEAVIERLRRRPPILERARISVGRAQRLRIPSDSVQLTLTSPPYLTRIDYAVALSRELAVLGMDAQNQSALREQLMGTTRIRTPKGTEIPGVWGEHLRETLEAVRGHESKDAAGYYFKQKLQYFHDLHTSLAELQRVTAPLGLCQIVVQDSYFKDVPLRLGDLVVEAAESYGWQLENAERHPVTRSLVTMNSSARSYHKEPVVESVLLLRKVSR
jgi:hypothetical protein